MSSSYRLVGFSAVLLVAAAGAGAQFSEPSHPLSQIDPVDVALNMSNEAIKNVSAVSFSNPSGGGYVIDNYEISDQSGVSELELVPPGASGQGQFQVKGANLNISTNNVTDVDEINPSGRNLEVGGDVVSRSGSYTSNSTEVCVGDQCER